jgi:hypothetical protein
LKHLRNERKPKVVNFYKLGRESLIAAQKFQLQTLHAAGRLIEAASPDFSTGI